MARREKGGKEGWEWEWLREKRENHQKPQRTLQHKISGKEKRKHAKFERHRLDGAMNHALLKIRDDQSARRTREKPDHQNASHQDIELEKLLLYFEHQQNSNPPKQLCSPRPHQEPTNTKEEEYEENGEHHEDAGKEEEEGNKYADEEEAVVKTIRKWHLRSNEPKILDQFFDHLYLG